MSAEHEQHPLFLPLVFAGGLIFGFGLGFSHMAQPEIVLNFLQLEDFGLMFVMFGAAVVTGITFFGVGLLRSDAPLTGTAYGRRLKALDRNVVLGGGIFGVGWGLSGICPGAAYASLGVGNVFILYGIAGMFVGAYAQGFWRSQRAGSDTATAAAD
ncbi:YeeE/YedE family protein [Halobacteria archaeon AArc-dxtr1]|nr:YeeE/YedE family protein [Halobacteria archaeon AArc-dxtr1]